jgi:hypothetical protein
MANNRPVNPTNLPWFPFYAAAWLGSDTVMKMTMTEAGIYINLMTLCWQYGSIPWDKTLLSKHLNVDQRTIGRFMEEYKHLTSTFHEGSKKVPSTLHEPSMKVTLPKVQEFAETLGKNGGAPAQSRGEETKGKGDDADADRQAASLPHSPLSTKGQMGKNKPVKPTSQLPSDEEVPPVPKQSSSRCEATNPEPASPSTGSAIKPASPLNIRDWPETEDRFGISGTRLRNCIRYQLDVTSEGWYRDKAYPTVTKLNSEKYVTKLNADTPAGWTSIDVEQESIHPLYQLGHAHAGVPRLPEPPG